MTSKRTAIVHLFGGGFFVGNKNAGYIINDAKALGARGYTNISANYRLQTGFLAGADPRRQGRDPLDPRERRAPRRRPNRIVVAGYSAGGMLSLMAAGTNGKKEFEGDGGNAGVSSDVNACIGVYPLASAQIATGLFPQGQATPENIAAASPTSYISDRASRRRSSFTARRTARSRCSRASTSSPSSTRLGVPSALTLIQGADHAFDNSALDAVEVMAQSIDLFLDRLIVNPKPYPSFGGGGGGAAWRTGRPARRRTRRPGVTPGRIAGTGVGSPRVGR